LSATPSNGEAPFASNLTARAYGCVELCEITFFLSNASGSTNVGPDPGPYASNGENVSEFAYIPSDGEWIATAAAQDQLGDTGEANVTINASLGNGPLAISVSATPNDGQAPLTVTFNANATGGTPPYRIEWLFGDEGNGTGAVVKHTYGEPGNYTVLTDVWDSKNVHLNKSTPVRVSSGIPGHGTLIAALTATPAVGSVPLNVTLKVSATGGTAPYSLTVCAETTPCSLKQTGWNGSTEQFETSYTSVGNYSVSATVTDTRGNQSTATASVTVSAYVALSVRANSSTRSGVGPLTVSFIASLRNGSAPFTIQWAFGDGSFGTSYNNVATSHVYQNAGTYSPTLRVEDSSGRVRNLTLPSITVESSGASAPSLRPLPSVSNPTLSWISALAVLALGAGIAVGGLYQLDRRRLRREGEEILHAIDAQSAVTAQEGLDQR
jgi:PKD repeat protein